MNGRIVTFYSWKGGVGRTMALANAGVQLARRGKRVLLVDWDLEAPGLERYFLNTDKETTALFSITKPSDESGLLGILCSLTSDASQNLDPQTWQNRRMTIDVPRLPETIRTSSALPSPQPLHLIGSGIRISDYVLNLQSFSWSEFFAEHNGGQWLEILRNQWRKNYDVVLIDSRTGLTDSGGVCTVQMPDSLVLVFTPNTQSLDDGLAFLNGVQKARADFIFERSPLTVIPLLARWEGDKEVDLAADWIDRIVPSISRLVDTWLPSDLPVARMLERLRVPHVARFSFGEPLPVLTHSLTDSGLPGLAYDLLATILANGFADAGRIIDPGYKPPFDPVQATDTKIDALLSNDDALNTTLKNIAALSEEKFSEQIDGLMRIADRGLQLGRLSVADNITKRVASTIRQLMLKGTSNPRLNKALLITLFYQGDIRQAQGMLAEAMLVFRESIELIHRLEKTNPSDTAWQRDLSVSQEKIGDVLRLQGDLDGALNAFRESLAVSQRLAAADPSHAGWQRDLSVSQEKIGDVLRDQGDLDGALNAFRESLAVRKRLAAADPSHAGWQRDLSVSLTKLAEIHEKQSESALALPFAEQSLSIDERLSALDKSNVMWQKDVEVSRRLVNRLREAIR